jgi:hypothetical protein
MMETVQTGFAKQRKIDMPGATQILLENTAAELTAANVLGQSSPAPDGHAPRKRVPGSHPKAVMALERNCLRIWVYG